MKKVITQAKYLYFADNFLKKLFSKLLKYLIDL